MTLLDLPQDVILSILYALRVEEILMLETVCKYLRQFILYDARHMWLRTLNELEPACAPDIPRHVDINGLSCYQLRSIIIRAVRIYWSMIRASPPEAKYALKETITPPRPERLAGDEHCVMRSVKFAPGGRYIFVLWASRPPYSLLFDCDEELSILDTENANRCVWSYDLSKNHSGDRLVFMSDYDFEVRCEGSITLAMMNRAKSDGDTNSFNGVLRLLCDSTTGAFQEELCYSHRARDQKISRTGSACLVAGDFAIFVDRYNAILDVINWRENHLAKLKVPDVTQIGLLRIWKDHLFYFDVTRQGIWAIPLHQTKPISTAQSEDTQVVHIDCLDRSFLELFATNDQDGESFLVSVLRQIRYSIYDRPWDSESRKAIFTIIAHASTYLPRFVVIRASFDSSAPTQDRWKLTDMRRTIRQRSTLKLSVRSELTRSGRLLASVWETDDGDDGFPGNFVNHVRPGLGLVSVDHRGNVAFQRLPEALTQLSKKRRERDRETSMEVFLEEYSGAVVVWRDKRVENDSFDIYYPTE